MNKANYVVPGSSSIVKTRMRSASLWILLSLTAITGADPRSAEEWYKEGETQYNLGNFDRAAEAFKQGYAVETAESKKAAYLYNVAQAYRQGKRCKDAAFFYKRYLSLKEQDTVKPLRAERRTEIEGWITELQECEKAQALIAAKPPDATLLPEGTDSTKARSSGSSRSSTGENAEGTNEESGAWGQDSPSPSLLSVRAAGGGSKIHIGSRDVPIQATLAMFAGYPIMLTDHLVLDLGVAATLTPLPYAIGDASKTALLTSALGDVGLTYEFGSTLAVRADLGIGALIFSNMGELGNPFTVNMAPTTGALTMLAGRGALSVDLAITPSLIVTLTPLAYSYSPPKAGLLDEIKSIQRFDLTLGIGYRM